MRDGRCWGRMALVWGLALCGFERVLGAYSLKRATIVCRIMFMRPGTWLFLFSLPVPRNFVMLAHTEYWPTILTPQRVIQSSKSFIRYAANRNQAVASSKSHSEVDCSVLQWSAPPPHPPITCFVLCYPVRPH